MFELARSIFFTNHSLTYFTELKTTLLEMENMDISSI